MLRGGKPHSGPLWRAGPNPDPKRPHSERSQTINNQPEFESCVVVASGPPRVYHPGGDPPEPVLIAERPGEHLRLLEVIQHACPIAEREKRSPNLETNVDGQLASAAGLGQMT